MATLDGYSTASVREQRTVHSQIHRNGSNTTSVRENDNTASGMHVEETIHSQIYRNKISQLQSENKHLKELLIRHQDVLKEYQIAYPELKPTTNLNMQPSDGIEAPLAPLPPWVASPESLGPLLAAYDRRVQELEGKLDAHKLAVGHLKDEQQGSVCNTSFGGIRSVDSTNRMPRYAMYAGLASENEALRNEVQHYVDKLLARGEDSGNISIAAEQEMNSLQQQYELAQESNQVMNREVCIVAVTKTKET